MKLGPQRSQGIINLPHHSQYTIIHIFEQRRDYCEAYSPVDYHAIAKSH